METLWQQVMFGVTGSVLATVAVAMALVASQSARYRAPDPGAGLRFPASAADYGDPLALTLSTPSGDSPIPFRCYPARSPGRPLLILIHGSGWHSMQFHRLGRAIAGKDVAEVMVPDMRGHGPSAERRSDVDFIGQMEADAAGLIDAVGRGRRVILGRHSSGRGFVIRFAGGKFGHKADAFVLLAPFLHHSATP